MQYFKLFFVHLVALGQAENTSDISVPYKVVRCIILANNYLFIQI